LRFFGARLTNKYDDDDVINFFILLHLFILIHFFLFCAWLRFDNCY